MSVVALSIPAVLRERASLQPNDAAFTFLDYGQNWGGIAKSLTWSQLYRRVLSVANELRLCGSSGNRAVVVAPQGLDYIIVFLGVLQAGFIAVPLTIPQAGASDESVDSMLVDASPTGILTASDAVYYTGVQVRARRIELVPSIIEVDLLDVDSNFSDIKLKNLPLRLTCNMCPVRRVILWGL